MINLPITKPFVGEEEESAVQEVLKSGWLVQGAKVQAFEQSIAEHEQVSYCCATTSCTTALQLSMLASGMTEKMDVIAPSYTFVATANAIASTGATPVLVDVDEKTYNLDSLKLEQFIQENYLYKDSKYINKKNGNELWGIVPVHQFGLCADMQQINDVARKYGLNIIEDGACALGSMINNTHIGGFGNTVCVSFHPRKSITTGEGGMILTNDRDIYDKVIALRNHGSMIASDKRHNKNGSLLPEYIYQGYNYRMTDIQGAIGCEQMKKFDFILKRRQEIAAYYNELIQSKCSNICIPYVPSGYFHSYQSYVCMLNLEVDLEKAEKKRNEIMRNLADVGVATRQGTHAIHKLACYKEKYGYSESSLPVADRCDRLSISLPVFATITRKEQDYIVEKLKAFSEI